MKRNKIDKHIEPPVAFAAFDRLLAGATTGTAALFSTNTTVSTFSFEHDTSEMAMAIDKLRRILVDRNPVSETACS